MVVAATATALAAAACGGSASATGTTAAAGSGAGAPPTTGVGGGAPSASTAPSPTPSSTGVPPAVDPCQLVPAGEASSLAGASFGAGIEEAESAAKQCIYGAQTSNVFTIFVLQAASRAQAEAGKQQFLAALRKKAGNQLHVTQLPNLADGGVLAHASVSGNGVTVAGSAIDVLKGTIAFGISDLVVGGKAPSDAALLKEAQAVLARLP
jgi:hypothetical protein